MQKTEESAITPYSSNCLEFILEKNGRKLYVRCWLTCWSSLTGAQNKFARFLLCCLKCCFWCLEKFMKFINRNAYIMVGGFIVYFTSHTSSSHRNVMELYSIRSIMTIWPPGGNLWQKLLHVCQRCLIPPHEEHDQVILLGVCNCIILHIYTLMSVMFNFTWSVSFVCQR